MQYSVLTKKMSGNGNELISEARVELFRLRRRIIAVKYCNMGCRVFEGGMVQNLSDFGQKFAPIFIFLNEKRRYRCFLT